ncbi:MAG: hypothetical protein AAGH57_02315 [Pseudomonadota bacterium]
MHKGLSLPSNRRSGAKSGRFLRRGGLSKALIFVALAAFLVLALAAFLVLALAWIDGGEEPIRAIRQPVALPKAGEAL